MRTNLKLLAVALAFLATPAVAFTPGDRVYDVGTIVKRAEALSGLSSSGKRPTIIIADNAEEWVEVTGAPGVIAKEIGGKYYPDGDRIYLRSDYSAGRYGVSIAVHEAVHFLQDVNGLIPEEITPCVRSRLERQAHEAEKAELLSSGLNVRARVRLIDSAIDRYADECSLSRD
jgi:hypothetical protein